MKNIDFKMNMLIIFALWVASGTISCNRVDEHSFSTAQTSSDFIFLKGEKVTNENFTGTVWLNYLSESDTIYNVNIGSVTFEPGARTNWHSHKGGQILLITDGEGLYQEKGNPIEIVKKGDVIKCLPTVEHWHGATPTKAMTHIAIGTNTNRGGAVWSHPVTDEEFKVPDQ